MKKSILLFMIIFNATSIFADDFSFIDFFLQKNTTSFIENNQKIADRKQEIIDIGVYLGNQIKKDQIANYYDKYDVEVITQNTIHIADIISILTLSTIDSPSSLNLIIFGYLTTSYNLPEAEALKKADYLIRLNRFIYDYPFLYFFAYKKLNLSTQERIGLSQEVANWPGNAKVYVPATLFDFIFSYLQPIICCIILIIVLIVFSICFSLTHKLLKINKPTVKKIPGLSSNKVDIKEIKGKNIKLAIPRKKAIKKVLNSYNVKGIYYGNNGPDFSSVTIYQSGKIIIPFPSRNKSLNFEQVALQVLFNEGKIAYEDMIRASELLRNAFRNNYNRLSNIETSKLTRIMKKEYENANLAYLTKLLKNFWKRNEIKKATVHEARDGSMYLVPRVIHNYFRHASFGLTAFLREQNKLFLE